jgi:hypothetical protein
MSLLSLTDRPTCPGVAAPVDKRARNTEPTTEPACTTDPARLTLLTELGMYLAGEGPLAPGYFFALKEDDIAKLAGAPRVQQLMLAIERIDPHASADERADRFEVAWAAINSIPWAEAEEFTQAVKPSLWWMLIERAHCLDSARRERLCERISDEAALPREAKAWLLGMLIPEMTTALQDAPASWSNPALESIPNPTPLAAGGQAATGLTDLPAETFALIAGFCGAASAVSALSTSKLMRGDQKRAELMLPNRVRHWARHGHSPVVLEQLIGQCTQPGAQRLRIVLLENVIPQLPRLAEAGKDRSIRAILELLDGLPLPSLKAMAEQLRCVVQDDPNEPDNAAEAMIHCRLAALVQDHGLWQGVPWPCETDPSVLEKLRCVARDDQRMTSEDAKFVIEVARGIVSAGPAGDPARLRPIFDPLLRSAGKMAGSGTEARLWEHLGQMVYLLPLPDQQHAYDRLTAPCQGEHLPRVVLGFIRTCHARMGVDCASLDRCREHALSMLISAGRKPVAVRLIHACFGMLYRMPKERWAQGWNSARAAGLRCPSLRSSLLIDAISARHLGLLGPDEATDKAGLFKQFLKSFREAASPFDFLDADHGMRCFPFKLPQHLGLLPQDVQLQTFKTMVEMIAAFNLYGYTAAIFNGLECLREADAVSAFDWLLATAPLFSPSGYTVHQRCECIRFVHLLPDKDFLRIAGQLVEWLRAAREDDYGGCAPLVRALLSRFARLDTLTDELQQPLERLLSDVVGSGSSDAGFVNWSDSETASPEYRLDMLDLACRCLRHVAHDSRMRLFEDLHSELVGWMEVPAGAGAPWTLVKLCRATLEPDFCRSENERARACDAIITAIDSFGMDAGAALLLCGFVEGHAKHASRTVAEDWLQRARRAFVEPEQRWDWPSAGWSS